MIVYQATKASFNNDVITNKIDEVIFDNFKNKIGRGTSESEKQSWRDSMMYMQNILEDGGIPEDTGVMIEYQIPQTSNRIDFILTGKNENNVDHAIIVELKRWGKIELTEMDGVVSTYVGKGNREVSHPSYQAWSYAALLNNFNEAVQKNGIELKPCAYLHNYSKSDDIIDNEFYYEHIKKAPLFLRSDALKLREFIKQFVKYGDKGKVMYEIENGKIRPSKSLADSLEKMLKGNQEFVMIDDQKVVYEKALYLSQKSSEKEKNVLIVEGGPGTGKTVVAINLLVEMTKREQVVQYITKNSAPRAVYQSKLTGTMKKTEISSLFTGSGSFVNTKSNIFDSLIVDEAHRLNEKSGLFKNKGENQIKEIINASKFSVFFIDEDQKVTFDDIGEMEEIKKFARQLGANVYYADLTTQFRCNGSDGYLAWLDNALQIRETANKTLDGIDFDFRIIDDPNELREVIFEKNKINNKARLVAGYCWDWVSKRNGKIKDIIIPEYNFEMKWNLGTTTTWAIDKDSVNEIGCIHTSQGLEFDYVGVIVGPDLIIREGNVLVDPSRRAKTDNSLKGYKKLLKESPEEAKEKIRAIIKNTYRTLMTRGMKGCYVYFVDNETSEYFKNLIGR